jgi:hypothetical protein
VPDPAEIVRVAVAEVVLGDNTMLFGLERALRPVDPLAESVIVPPNSFKPTRLIVDCPEDPAKIAMEEGLAVIVKSTTVMVTGKECERVPIVAVTLNV